MKPFANQLLIDFASPALGYRLLKGGGKNQLIAKAVGIKNRKQSLRVLDATAGLGVDAFILASLGCKVHLIERSPVIGGWLQEGMERAKVASHEISAIINNMTLTIADSKSIISEINVEDSPDVIYLDPMFPHSKKSALVKKELRMLREIVGDDLDGELLLPLSLGKAKSRVVVKRAIRAPALLSQKIPPSFVVKGISNRYDIYLT